MKKKILILVSLFILFVVVLTPASLIENIMPPQKNISISGLSGSLWSGEISQISAMGKQFDDVKFSITPFALFLATLSLDLDIPRGDISGDLNVVLDSDYAKNIALNDVNLSVKAASLQSYLPIRNVDLAGNINTSDFSLLVEDKKPVAVNGQVSWKKAAITYAGQQWVLGDFIVDASTDETSKIITGQLQKTKNELDLQGKFSLSPNGMFEFVGSISTDSEQALYQAVALFNNGKPANGRLPIKFKQKVL